MNIIVTAGTINGRIAPVVNASEITTGLLGRKIAESLMLQYPVTIENLFYIAGGQNSKSVRDLKMHHTAFHPILQRNTQHELHNALYSVLSSIKPNKKISVMIHCAYIGNCRTAYSVSTESLARELADLEDHSYESIMKTLLSPLSENYVEPGSTSVIAKLDPADCPLNIVKQLSPDTKLIAVTLTSPVSSDYELECQARDYMKETGADCVIAKDPERERVNSIRTYKQAQAVIIKDGEAQYFQNDDDMLNAMCKAVIRCM